jgi:hypothetical protein
LLGACIVGFGEGDVGLGQRQIGLGLRQRVLERPLVDREQEVALLDELPIPEMHLFQVAGHAGTDLDHIHRHEAADILVLVDDRPLHGFCNRHRRRWRCGRLFRRLTAASQGQQRAKQDRSGVSLHGGPFRSVFLS